MSDLAFEYAMATEWNLATLEELALIKGTSASRIRRQRDICEKMLGVYSTLEYTPYGVGSRGNRLVSLMRRGMTAQHALDKEIATMREGWTT